MKKIIICLLFIAGSSFYSCNDDYLESEPTEKVPNGPVEYKINGIYNLMIKPGSTANPENPETSEYYNHDDFGQKSYDIFMDLVQSDVVLDGTTYYWYANIANFSDVIDFTKNTNYAPWRYYYKVIYAANDIIDDLGGNDVNNFSSAEHRHVYGQAKAIRAYAYFYLMQMYTPSYKPNDSAIPLYLSKTNIAQARAKQSEVYSSIISDLKTSQDLLIDFSRNNKGRVDKTVATGLLAYTYAAIGENGLATIEASKIVNSNYPITSKADVAYDPEATSTYQGFNNLNNPSWIWGYDITLENGLDLASWWAQMDIFTYGYASVGDTKSIDINLYNAIRSDDVRLKQFILAPEFNDTYLASGKFFTPARIIDGQRSIETDYLYMRADEFHLLYAETLAKSGDEMASKIVLKNFLLHRLNDVSYIDSLTGENLLDEIYLQTRLELWGEGKAYLAMKRNNKPIVRGSTHLFYADQTFSVGSAEYYFKIPQAEIIDNPNINK